MGSARLTVERPRSIAGFNSVFRVMLDDHQVAVVPPGQTRTVTTSPGEHELYIRIRRRKMSATLTLHIRSDEELVVRCGPPRTALEGLTRLLRFQTPNYESVIPIELVDPNHDASPH